MNSARSSAPDPPAGLGEKSQGPLSPPQITRADGRETHAARLGVLDGWRGISILLVLACHMLPLGPKSWELNTSAALAGMSFFFTLSGFLITSTLLKNPDPLGFAIRRGFRILPLAYLATLLLLQLQGAGVSAYLAHFLFYNNYSAAATTPLTSHFWSLCVEVHFYAFVGVLVGFTGRRGLLALPILALVVTAVRVHDGAFYNIKTHLRVDEILAGAILALVWHDSLGRFGRLLASLLRRTPGFVFIALFALSCHPLGGPLQFARPYLGMATVAHTLLSPGSGWAFLKHRSLRYVAEVSYALYVIHPSSMYGWLGSGDTLVRYAKRPLCFLISFALAHLSTFHMERRAIALGKRIARKLENPSSSHQGF